MPVFFKLETDFLNGVSATSVVSIYWWYIFYLDTRWRKAQFFLDDCNKYHPNTNFTHDSNKECIIFLDFAVSVLDNKGWYTYDVHENCPIFKTTHTLVHLHPKFLHPLDLGWTSHFRRTPWKRERDLSLFLQMITNQLKEKIIHGWLLYVIRTFPQVSFRFQYQPINLVWLSFDFFYLAEASLLYLLFVALYSCVCSCPKISRNVFYL